MGRIIDNQFELVNDQPIGQGGFGETFLAINLGSPNRRKCILKHFKPDPSIPQDLLPKIKARFEKEAKVLDNLGEKNDQIPTLIKYFQEGEHFYIAQEYIRGKTLEELVEEQGAFSEEYVIQFLLAFLPVLEFVHSKGVIHLDIKPSNIILRDEDQKPVLIDFGAVKEPFLTIPAVQSKSIAVGTPQYMAPEQALLNPMMASDLYSVGLTCLFLLTGLPPHRDPTTGKIIWDPSIVGIRNQFSAILYKAVESDWNKRYKNVQEMKKAVNELALSEPQPIPIRRFPIVKIALVMLPILILIFIARYWQTWKTINNSNEASSRNFNSSDTNNANLNSNSGLNLNSNSAPITKPTVQPSKSTPAPNNKNMLTALIYIKRCQELYAAAKYEAAIEECNKGLKIDPQNKSLLKLRERINNTRSILKDR